MKLLVIGATGPTGQEIVRQASEGGHQVTALVRDAAKARFAPSVQKAVGDVLDPASLERRWPDRRGSSPPWVRRPRDRSRP